MREWTDPRDGEKYYAVRTRARQPVGTLLLPQDLVAFWSLRGIATIAFDPRVSVDVLDDVQLASLLDEAKKRGWQLAQTDSEQSQDDVS